VRLLRQGAPPGKTRWAGALGLTWPCLTQCANGKRGEIFVQIGRVVFHVANNDTHYLSRRYAQKPSNLPIQTKP
jgi:hypothetical protein